MPTAASPFIDYYELMQISPNAERETIQRVYHMLARRYHPDQPNTADMERFLLLNEAYEVLGNPRGGSNTTPLTTRAISNRWMFLTYASFRSASTAKPTAAWEFSAWSITGGEPTRMIPESLCWNSKV